MTNGAQLTDLELLNAWAAGNPRAAADLMDRHFDGLCRFFRSKMGGDVVEMLQHTLRIGLQTRRRCRNGVSVRAHLFAIARNLLFAYDEPGALRETAEIEVITHEGARPSSEQTELGAPRVRAALRRLPLDHQIALELHYWERLDGTELAHVLRLTEDCVPQHLRRGREMLRRELAQTDEDTLDTMTNLVALESSDDDGADRPASEG